MTKRVRLWIAAVVLIVSAAGWTAWVSSGALDPIRLAERDGEVMLSLYRVTAQGDDGSTVVEKGGHRFVVGGLPESLLVGEELSLSVVADGSQWSMTWMQRHPGRSGKRSLGFVGIVATGLLLVVGARRRDNRLWFRG